VWRRLRAIPHGATLSYAELAREVGRPSAVRAVARANGDNRLAIVVPCHRVIGSDGRLTGYGGGLWRKQWLLDLERGSLERSSRRSEPARAGGEGRGDPQERERHEQRVEQHGTLGGSAWRHRSLRT